MTGRIFAAMGLGVAATLLNGCAIHDGAQAVFEKEEKKADSATVTAETVAEKVPRKPIRTDAPPYLGPTTKAAAVGSPLPARFEGKEGWTYYSSQPVTPESLARALRVYGGLSAYVDGEFSGKGSTPTPTAAVTTPIVVPQASVAALDTSQGAAVLKELLGSTMNAGGTAPKSVRLSPYTGPLSQWLSQSLASFGMTYSHKSGALVISRTACRTYDVEGLDGVVNASAQLGQTGGTATPSTSNVGTTGSVSSIANGVSGTTSGTDLDGSQSGGVSATIDTKNEILDAVKGIIGTGSDYYSLSEASRTVYACTDPIRHQRLQSWLEDWNQRVSRKVAVSITLVSISESKSSDLGVDAAINYLNPKSGVGLGLTPSNITSLAGDGFNFSVVSPPNGSTRWNGTQTVVKALMQNTDASVVAATTRPTGNNRPVVFRDVTLVPRITGASGAITTGLSQATTTRVVDLIGNQLYVMPSLRPTGEVELTIAISRTSPGVQQTAQIVVGTATTPVDISQTLESSTSPFSVSVIPGSVVAILEKDSVNVNSADTGSPWTALFSGIRSNVTHDRSRLLILISAREWNPREVVTP